MLPDFIYSGSYWKPFVPHSLVVKLLSIVVE